MQDNAELAVLNGFGISLGDSIIGLQALHIARQAGAIGGRVVLGRAPTGKPMVDRIYDLAADLAEVRPMAEAATCGRVIDIRDFAFDPAFRGVAMIDYFLGRLGMDPAKVPASRKRNSWLAPRIRLPACGNGGYVLVCPRTSIPLRAMPEAVHAHILRWLLAQHDAPVMTQGATALPSIIHAPECTTVAELCALVANAALVISTDTAMVHLADAFAVPCLAFFVTHRPEWRVRDYPGVTPVHLPAPLPEALEFPRGPEDVAIGQAAWFPQGCDLTWLDLALDSFIATEAATIRPLSPARRFGSD